MKRIMTFFAVSVLLVACSRNAITGRKQLTLYPSLKLPQPPNSNTNNFFRKIK
jgi:hypothetical protein